jgi:hypothetical protein
LALLKILKVQLRRPPAEISPQAGPPQQEQLPPGGQKEPPVSGAAGAEPP